MVVVTSLDTAAQEHALDNAGADIVFLERASGGRGAALNAIKEH